MCGRSPQFHLETANLHRQNASLCWRAEGNKNKGGSYLRIRSKRGGFPKVMAIDPGGSDNARSRSLVSRRRSVLAGTVSAAERDLSVITIRRDRLRRFHLDIPSSLLC